LKDLFLQHNAARPSYSFIKGQDLALNCLLNVRVNDNEPSILETWNQFKEFFLPARLPFALDPFGNIFCLDVSQANAIYLFYHDSFDDDKRFAKIASNLNELLLLLTK
jgi:hypothetical protein